MQSGRRAWACELSTIDTAFLLAGTLAAAAYFSRSTAEESEIRNLAEALYCRADWQWAQNRGETVTHGGKPETGFLRFRWERLAVKPSAHLLATQGAIDLLSYEYFCFGQQQGVIWGVALGKRMGRAAVAFAQAMAIQDACQQPGELGARVAAGGQQIAQYHPFVGPIQAGVSGQTLRQAD